jgi:hypothetical protein
MNSNLKTLLNYVNDIYKLHAYYKAKLSDLESCSFDFLLIRPIISPKLIRSTSYAYYISDNQDKFFGNNQMIEFYEKINSRLNLMNKIIKNISKKLFNNIDPIFFISTIKDYLVPTYNNFYKIYPCALFKTFHVSYLNIKKLTIFLVRILILEYDDILILCPSLYNVIISTISEIIYKYKKISKSILYTYISCFIDISIKIKSIPDYYNKNDYNHKNDYNNTKKLEDTIYSVLNMFIINY